MDFGFGGNGATMHSLPDLARHIADAFRDLKSAASGKDGGRPSAARPASRRPREKIAKPARARK
jgi:Sec-independent protein translocase protein TatA